MEFLYLIFYASLRLRFLDVETNHSPRLPVPDVCRIIRLNVRGLTGNLSDPTVASSQYDILMCSETLVTDTCQVTELLVPGYINQTENPRRWGRVGESGKESECAGPRCSCHMSVIKCLTSF